MDGHLRLSASERKACLKVYRAARPARRALVALLLAEGMSYRAIRQATLASPTLIRAVGRGYAAGGIDCVLGMQQPVTVAAWLLIVARWLLQLTPRDFGYFRSRWSCAILAALLWEREGMRIGAETVRRGLHRMNFVWRRRPRPVVGPHDPDYEEKLRRIQRLIARLPAHETVVFQDEVDIQLNPQIGACWMRKGQQSEVVTPGNNRKCHAAGSLHWRTGRLLLSPPGPRRNAELFVQHVDDLRRRLRAFRKIHVVCDNARFHDCRAVREYLAKWGDRIELHYLPKYAPETNPIERVWWHLRETITRNHRCRTLEELVAEVYEWTETEPNFFIQTISFHQMYKLTA